MRDSNPKNRIGSVLPHRDRISLLRIFYFEKFVQLKDSIYIYTGNLIRKENANACSSGTARCA